LLANKGPLIPASMPHEPLSAPRPDALASLPRLGVGLLYNAALPDFLQNNLDAWDYAEIIPDMFWTDQGKGHALRYVELESWVESLDWIAARRPIIAHNISLSIGSAGRFDADYVEQIARWQGRYRFPWHSDHLSFAQIRDAEGQDHHAGLAIPIPYDHETLDMVVDRVTYVQRHVPIPFLLENNVYYIDIPEQEMTEPEFLNRLTARTGCGLLLDLHNLYANARNHGFDPADFLDRLDLSRVVEVHIAGGNELGGMYADSHAGPCPTPVWELLDRVAPTAPNLCAITFEFHESYYPILQTKGIRAQLERARRVWARCQ
jgi:uncharacterized protein (UPF0276 family)